MPTRLLTIEYPLFSYAPCRANEFAESDRRELLQESMFVKGTRFPVCMYPGCNEQEPDTSLECHHIQPRRYGGDSSVANGIVFCPTHHQHADRFLVCPSDCHHFKRDHNPHAPLMKESLSTLTSHFETVWEFSREVTGDSNDVWRRLAGLLFAVRNHSKRRTARAQSLIAWLLSDMAAFLTARIRGLPSSNSGPWHNRRVISELLRASCAYNVYARDGFLRLRNNHVRAVNYGAMLRLEEATKTFYGLLTQYALNDTSPNGILPIDHAEYKSYVLRQCVATFAKTNSYAPLELATAAINTARTLEGANQGHAYYEARVRQLQAAVLLGSAKQAANAAQAVLPLLESASGIQLAIGCKILAFWAMRRGNMADAAYFVSRGLRVARPLQLEHQVGQLEEVRRNWERGSTLAFARGRIDIRSLAGA